MVHGVTESQRRLYDKLYRDLGVDIIKFLQDKDIQEVMLNPDGKIWVDSVSKGLLPMSTLNSENAFSIINAIAGIHNFVVSEQCPRLEAELPYFKTLQGERFTAQVPPIVPAPSFTIRKKSEVIFTLTDYVETGRLTPLQADVIRNLVREHKNILVAGGPGSGKTTLTNALIIEAVHCDENQRFIILEDLPELQCSAPNKVAMLTSTAVCMRELLRLAMRMRPDRILIGEVRGSEALDMLKAWNTGCPGGICTVHANGCKEAVQRILDLAMEAGLTVPPIKLLHHTVDAIVFVTRSGNKKGVVQEVVAIKEVINERFSYEKLA